MKRFLSKAVKEGKGAHDWKIVLNPMDFAGIGIGNLRSHSKVLQAK